MFAKIFSQIFDSSISADYMTRHIFMDLLVLADRDGVVDMTTDAIARRTNVPEEMIVRAIAQLVRPDPRSRSQEEDGCRLVAIDSHRDWGWQIVNYEHYRNIRDEEARRTYFRDKKREQRSNKTAPSPKPSNRVQDSPTNSTQGEGELEGNGEKEQRPSRAQEKTRDPDSGSEFMLATNLLEEIGVPADPGLVRIAAECIRLLAKEGGTIQTAAEYILDAGRRAQEQGEIINRFWFTDQRYRPREATKTRRQIDKEAKRKAFLEEK